MGLSIFMIFSEHSLIIFCQQKYVEALSLIKPNKVQFHVSQILFNNFFSLLISVSSHDLLFSSNENVSNYLFYSQTALLTST